MVFIAQHLEETPTELILDSCPNDRPGILDSGSCNSYPSGIRRPPEKRQEWYRAGSAVQSKDFLVSTSDDSTLFEGIKSYTYRARSLITAIDD